MAASNTLISNPPSDQISINPTNISGDTGTSPPTSDLEWYFIQLVNDDRAIQSLLQAGCILLVAARLAREL